MPSLQAQSLGGGVLSLGRVTLEMLSILARVEAEVSIGKRCRASG